MNDATTNRYRYQKLSTDSVKLLSVVMPNYNHGRHLERAILAILAQTRPADEIILIDDGSTDNSKDIIEKLKAQHSDIYCIFNEKNMGAIASINIGLQVATSRYVCMMAADDVANPDFFATALRALEKNPSASLFCSEVQIFWEHEGIQSPGGVRPIIRPSDKPRAFTSSETAKLFKYNDNFIVTLSAVFKRDLLIAEGKLNPDLESMADAFIAKKLALKYGFYFYPKILVTWLVHKNGLSQTSCANQEKAFKMLRNTCKQIDDNNIFPMGYAGLFEHRFRFSLCRAMLNQSKIDWIFIKEIGSINLIDRYLLSKFKQLPNFYAKTISLMWLTIRHKPYSLVFLMHTMIQRKIEELKS